MQPRTRPLSTNYSRSRRSAANRRSNWRLRKLDTVGSFMMTTAHPDDENNAMLAYFSHGKGFRTSLVTATHGEGGQNEIGPELFVPLAVLRTEELAAAHRFDGAEQYFTRAIDFGFSFSIEETLEKWGHQEILGDFVRMIRTIRPDVIVGFVFDGDGGGQHHQASTRLTLEAFRAAADPARFPEQIKEGLRPWQASKFYYTTAGFGPPRCTAVPRNARTRLRPTSNFTGGDVFDPILGRTYNEIGGEARSMHKCQGMSQLLPLPAPTGGGGLAGGGPGGVRAYRLARHGARRRRRAQRARDFRRRRYEPAKPVAVRRRQRARRISRDRGSTRSPPRSRRRARRSPPAARRQPRRRSLAG